MKTVEEMSRELCECYIQASMLVELEECIGCTPDDIHRCANILLAQQAGNNIPEEGVSLLRAACIFHGRGSHAEASVCMSAWIASEGDTASRDDTSLAVSLMTQLHDPLPYLEFVADHFGSEEYQEIVRKILSDPVKIPEQSLEKMIMLFSAEGDVRSLLTLNEISLRLCNTKMHLLALYEARDVRLLAAAFSYHKRKCQMKDAQLALKYLSELESDGCNILGLVDPD